MKSTLRVLFYLKKNTTKGVGCSFVMGRIKIGKTMSQFSLKIKVDANLWDSRVGRMISKNALSQETNRDISYRI